MSTSREGDSAWLLCAEKKQRDRGRCACGLLTFQRDNTKIQSEEQTIQVPSKHEIFPRSPAKIVLTFTNTTGNGQIVPVRLSWTKSTGEYLHFGRFTWILRQTSELAKGTSLECSASRSYHASGVRSLCPRGPARECHPGRENGHC